MVLANLRDIKVALEDTFGEGGTGGEFKSVRCVTQPKADPTRQVHEDPTIRQTLASRYKPILGLLSGSKVTFDTHLRGTGTAAGDGTTSKGSADLVEGLLLKCALGGEDLGTGTDVDDAAPTVADFDVGDASGLAEGYGVLCGTEASVISSVAGGNVSLLRALASAPADESVVYASTTYYPTESLFGTLEVQALGAEATADGYFAFRGCGLDLKLDQLDPGQLPKVVYEGTACTWTHHATGTLATPTFDNSTLPPVVGYASALYIGDYGDSTRNKVHFSSIKIDPGVAIEAVPSGSGIQGVQDYERSVIAPTVEITVYPFDYDWFSDFDNSTAKYIHLQIGSTAGATVLIELQRVYFDAVPERNPIGQQLGVTLKGKGFAKNTDTNERVVSPIRIHLL